MYVSQELSEGIKEIHVFARGQLNHSPEVLHAYLRILPIQAAQKDDLRKFCAQQVILPEVVYMIGLPPSQLKKKQEIIFQNQQLKILRRTMINANH